MPAAQLNIFLTMFKDLIFERRYKKITKKIVISNYKTRLEAKLKHCAY